MSRKRVHAPKPARTKRADELIELRPGVWMFTPAWATKRPTR